jgi:hypothetical protein
MNKLILMICLWCVLAAPARACLGPQSESAQESDASVIFEGRSKAYVFRPGAIPGVTSANLASVSFDVIRTNRGLSQKTWTVLMRGADLPKNLAEFQKRFGKTVKVGLRDFGSKVDTSKLPKGFQQRYFIVDAACNMNGEDWLLRTAPAHE